MNNEAIERNAEWAEREFGIKKQDYLDICEKFAKSIKHGQIIAFNAPMVTKIDTGFAVGLIAGYLYAKENSEIETILK